jgi:hypothetical protein
MMNDNSGSTRYVILGDVVGKGCFAMLTSQSGDEREEGGIYTIL